MTKNENGIDEYDYYHDFQISNYDLTYLQDQMTKIIATIFALIISARELVEYMSQRSKESEGIR